MANEKNILGDLVENIGEGLKDKLEDKIDPGKVFSEGNLKKKRGAFWTCLIAGLLLMALALGAAVYYNATKVSLLEKGIVENVDLASVGMDAGAAKNFAVSTLAYLQGTVSVWEPVIVVGDHIMPIPESFKTHMATVKSGFGSAVAVLLAGLGIVIVLLGRALVGTKGSKKSSFSVGGYYLGAGILLVAILGIGLWGYFGFDSLWGVLHKVLIPDGIFSAAEPIMQLFPVGLFAGYLQPVAMTFGLLAAIVLALPLLLKPLSLLLTSLFGKKSSGGSSSGAVPALPAGLPPEGAKPARPKRPPPAAKPPLPAGKEAHEHAYGHDKQNGSLAKQGFHSYPGPGKFLRRNRRRRGGKRPDGEKQRDFFPGGYPCPVWGRGAGNCQPGPCGRLRPGD